MELLPVTGFTHNWVPPCDRIWGLAPFSHCSHYPTALCSLELMVLPLCESALKPNHCIVLPFLCIKASLDQLSSCHSRQSKTRSCATLLAAARGTQTHPLHWGFSPYPETTVCCLKTLLLFPWTLFFLCFLVLRSGFTAQTPSK